MNRRERERRQAARRREAAAERLRREREAAERAQATALELLAMTPAADDAEALAQVEAEGEARIRHAGKRADVVMMSDGRAGWGIRTGAVVVPARGELTDDRLDAERRRDVFAEVEETRRKTKTSRAQKRAAASRKARRRAARELGAAAAAHVSRFNSKLRRAGQALANARGMVRRGWQLAHLAMRDGRGARMVVAQLPPEVRRAFVEHVMGVYASGPALWCPLRRDRSPRRARHWHRTAPTRVRQWSDRVVRKWAAALGVLWAGTRSDTRRRGFGHVTTGWSVGRIAATIPHADAPRGDGAKYTRWALSNVRDGLPVLLGLLNVGGVVLHAVQPPHAEAFALGDPLPATDRGPSGYAFNQYWHRTPGGRRDVYGYTALKRGLPGEAAHVRAELLEEQPGAAEALTAALDAEEGPEGRGAPSPAPGPQDAAGGLAEALREASPPPTRPPRPPPD